MRLREHLAETLRGLRRAGLHRHLPGPVDPRRDFASNDYLGLARHPELRRAVVEAARGDHPVGATASRLLSGDHRAHRAAETRLARFVGMDRAILLSSGYAANVSGIPALVGPGDLVLSDARNHASIIDGCRLSRARVEVVPHGDLEAAEAALRAHRGQHRICLLVTDAVFSMDGDAAPLAGLADLAESFDADLYVDEAHALGVRGPQGRGLCAELGVRPTVLLGTLGKAFGLAGSFLAGDEPVVDALVQRARGFVYSTGVAPVLAEAIPAATDLVEAAEGARSKLQRHAARVREAMTPRPEVSGPILPLRLGTAEAAMAASDTLRRAGLVVPAIRPPTVPAGSARLRIVPRADHREEDVARLAAALASLPRRRTETPWRPAASS